MVKRQAQLDKAQYKGVDILIETVNESGGRKIAIFDYVNSNKIYIDDLGAIPQTFKVDLIIHGYNFRYESEKFTKLLLEPEYGKLILPVLGAFTAKAVDYSKKTENKAIGQVSYSVTFMLDEAVGLEEETTTKEQIYQAYDNVNDAVYDELVAKYTVPKTRSNASSLISDFDSFTDAVKSVGKAVNGVASYARKVKNKINTYINKVETYANIMATDGAFAVFANLLGVGSAYTVGKELIEFGNDLPERLSNIESGFTSGDSGIPVFTEDFTPEWNDRNERRILQVLAIRNQAFALMLAGLPDLDIQTSERVATIKKEINEAYNSIFEADNISSYDTMNAMDELMLVCNTWLNQKQRDVWKFDTAKFPVISSRHLNYMLYNELGEDLEEVLIKENDKPFFEGETVILND